MGAQMLNDLGIKKIRLITNNPRKIAGLKGYGLEIVERLPLLIESNYYNSNYLATKAEKLGHLLLRTYLVTVAIEWKIEINSVAEHYQHLEQIRDLSRSVELFLQEEVRPVANALFEQPSIIFHLGFKQVQTINKNWYCDPNHVNVKAITQVLDNLVSWTSVKRLEFLISSEDDPMSGLQVGIKRHIFPLSKSPSQCTNPWEQQTIYSFTL
jgi:3,4-dihydroxy 2-butanone 4-phosphate synthase/GTP cyclohydrolase II